ncbi:hypothetical protein QYE76_053146 [Lolium multiflorum]|uniref:Transposase (putative) gypsy type domain-containing protein n=1 Tax=Lolium multiflorum TaxID=4521 RepID=A0AAD8WJI7_LOLMU|nr:hypothetical protein QYE76_053146 [Lolium multiflorum]
MGKKGATGSSASAGATKVSLDWCASTISNHELWQLTPNSILHISIFITLCEAFLGIDPHWDLWRKIFYVKRHNSNDGPPVVGGVGFVVGKEVNYLDYPMKESVQGWRQKWFYLRDIPAPGRRSNLPPFEDVSLLVSKKSWWNALTADESAIADQLYEKVLDLKSAGGLTMPPPLLSVILLHKSGVEPEDEDDSEETEDGQHDLEDSDVQGDEAPEDDARTRAMRHWKINEDFLTTAESSPSGQDDDDNVTASPRPAAKGFADEDDLDLQTNPSATELTPPRRTVVAKVPVSMVNPSASVFTPSTSRDHPIFATVDAVADFADQFTRLESENAQLRKAIKTSSDQVLEANRLTADAQNENILLKDELKKLKKRMKDEQEALFASPSRAY